MPDRYRLLIDSMIGIVWEADPATMRFTFVSESVSRILGYTPEEWTNNSSFLIDHTYIDDQGIVSDFLNNVSRVEHTIFDFRIISADERIVWIRNYITPIYEEGILKAVCGIMIDNTYQMQLEKLEQLEKEVLKINTERGRKIEDVLQFYTQGLERIFPKMKCSVLKITNNKAYNWASPSLPQQYIDDIEGLEVGPNKGSCGTAAYLAKTVIVSDIVNDEKWLEFKDTALASGLRACWSQPIINSDGVVMATFAMYYQEIKAPNENELYIIDRSTAILRVIIENEVYANNILEMQSMAIQGQRLANFGTWQLDLKSQNAIWSETLYDIYGVDPATFSTNYEGYLSVVHPDDRDKVRHILDKALETKSDATYEERIIRPDGEIRYLRSWFRIITDEEDKPYKFIGASMDISKAKENDMKMEHIAWQQSHVVRAPLARILGIIALLDDELLEKNQEQTTLYTALVESAHELDNIIREISHNTKKA